MQLRLEHWKCSNKATEEHYFIDNSENFVAGFNPEYVDRKQFEDFLLSQGFDLPIEKDENPNPCGG